MQSLFVVFQVVSLVALVMAGVFLLITAALVIWHARVKRQRHRSITRRAV